MIRDFQTASTDRYGILKDLARENRNHPTEAETMLWNVLKGGRFGVKFLRQHIILDYIVDFVCLERRLVVEVDGGYHSQTDQMAQDAYRTENLEKEGFRVIRFTNERVLQDTLSIIEVIQNELEYGNKQ